MAAVVYGLLGCSGGETPLAGAVGAGAAAADLADSGAGGRDRGADNGAAGQGSDVTLDPDASSGGAMAGAGDDRSIAVARFVVPPNTVVQEFSLQADALGPSRASAGQVLEVSVLDVSRPERDQTALCPGHPLEGCATVDYGAFGITHDNRILAPTDDGNAELHLHKDRSLRSEPEALPPDE